MYYSLKTEVINYSSCQCFVVQPLDVTLTEQFLVQMRDSKGKMQMYAPVL